MYVCMYVSILLTAYFLTNTKYCSAAQAFASPIIRIKR